MSIVDFALKRPYTIAAAVILLALLGGFGASRMPTDIFPEINIPVVSVVWTYAGMSAEEMETRVITVHERSLPSLVDDIERIESNSYNGVGVIKLYLHEGADVSRAVAQLSSSAQTVLKGMPPGITPPLVVRFSATDVPIIQLSLASDSLPDQRISDYGQNFVRPSLAVVHGAQVPYPYGGKPRVIMVDLDNQQLQSKGLSPADVTTALNNQNLIIPSGTAKIGDYEYMVALNNMPGSIEALNDIPIKTVGNATIYLRDLGHVRDGGVVQTNAVHVDGQPGGLMIIRKTGGASTLTVIDGIRKALPQIKALLPSGMSVKTLFDQSVFVRGALNGVLSEGAIAAGLTALMIYLFLGNGRLTSIILLSIPLSILAAVLVMYIFGESLNTMSLGGLSLAVGILVDNGTVVIENIERHIGMGKALVAAIIDGAHEIAFPTLVSTLAICIVFVPIFLLEGTAKFLFSPLAIAVIFSLLGSLILSFTLVPLMFKMLLGSQVHGHGGGLAGAKKTIQLRTANPLKRVHFLFEAGFHRFRNIYRNALAWSVHHARLTAVLFVVFCLVSALLYPQLGMDFFPQVDAGQLRLHVRAPAGTRIEDTQQIFGKVEKEIREIVGDEHIETMLDNVGLPYSGLNMALSDTATLGPMDGEILIALTRDHAPSEHYMSAMRRELPERFPQLQFFFQPADIVSQVLNFGQPAPIDIRVVGPKREDNYGVATKIAQQLKGVPGVMDVHLFQENRGPKLNIDVDRTLAAQTGMTQRNVANSMLVSLSSSQLVAPNYWVNPNNRVSYQLIVQSPTYRLDSLAALEAMPLSGGESSSQQQMLMNVATVSRGTSPMIVSHLDIRPVLDIQANIQSTDLASVAESIDEIVKPFQKDPSAPVQVKVAGQIETMKTSFKGLVGGMAMSIVLVYLLMVVNFQSWRDPAIILMAIPGALVGVIWMLYATTTHISVPALMGTIMCIGLTTANSILVVSFANQKMAAGSDALSAAIAAGFTRLRPVIMTAGAMMLGMLPMALGLGEGGEQNAPLARAVVGGLLVATFATLIFVPCMYRIMRSRVVIKQEEPIHVGISH